MTNKIGKIIELQRQTVRDLYENLIANESAVEKEPLEDVANETGPKEAEFQQEADASSDIDELPPQRLVTFSARSRVFGGKI